MNIIINRFRHHGVPEQFGCMNAKTSWYFYDRNNPLTYRLKIDMDWVRARDQQIKDHPTLKVTADPILLDIEMINAEVSLDEQIRQTMPAIDYYTHEYPNNLIYVYGVHPYKGYLDRLKWEQVKDQPDHPKYDERKARYDRIIDIEQNNPLVKEFQSKVHGVVGSTYWNDDRLWNLKKWMISTGNFIESLKSFDDPIVLFVSPTKFGLDLDDPNREIDPKTWLTMLQACKEWEVDTLVIQIPGDWLTDPTRTRWLETLKHFDDPTIYPMPSDPPFVVSPSNIGVISD